MKRRKLLCTACDKTLRKGAGKKALVFPLHGGPPRLGIVCPACALRGTLVVTEAPVTLAPNCAGCHREPAKYGDACMHNVSKNVGELSATNAALAAGARPPLDDGPLEPPRGLTLRTGAILSCEPVEVAHG